MDSSQHPKPISQDIQTLLEDKRRNTGGKQDGDQLLLSQLESVEGEDSPEQSVTTGTNETGSSTKPNTKDDTSEELVKVMKEIKKQNSTTHLLLSAMIALTLTWQLSEISLLLRLKEGLSHPFRSLGSMLLGIGRRSRRRVVNAEKQLLESSKEELGNLNIRMPELPRLGLPDFGFNDDDD